MRGLGFPSFVCWSGLRRPRTKLSMTTTNEVASLEDELGSIAGGTRSKLSGFYDKDLKSFAVQVGVNRFSVTSTACAVLALIDDGDELLEGVAGALLDAEWRENDLFQLGSLVYAVSKLATKRPASKREVKKRLPRLAKAIDLLIASRARMTDSYRQQLSCYLQFWLAEALISVIEKDHDDDDNFSLLRKSCGLKETARPLATALARAHEVARNEVCRQISYDASGDRRGFDVMRLAYSLLAYVSVGKQKDRIIELWQCGIDESDFLDEDFHRPGGPEEIEVNEKLVKRSLEALFAAQQDDGLWPPGQAIYARSRRGFDLGNAFVFAPDFAASLLTKIDASSLRPFVPQIRNLAHWCAQNDIDSKGWRSSHLESRQGPPVAWATAHVSSFAKAGVKVARTILTDDVLEEFKGTPYRKNTPPDPALFESLLDSDLFEDDPNMTLKSVFSDRFIKPRSLEDTPSVPAYSAVLFGPPGTAKTTTAKAVARALGFGFVVIDTATLLEAGLANVMARVAYVFGRLKKLQDCVILFDEVEEFCLDRRGALATQSVESRMLTTAMLTQINDLRQARRCVFFIATNRLTAFDSAIIRPGRIDLLLFVGTPGLEPRLARFQNKLHKKILNTDDPDQRTTAPAPLVDTFRKFLEKHWQADLQFFNFLESDRFADAAADALLTSNTADLDLILKDHKATIVLRDTESRQDYIADRRSTRL